MPARSVWLLIAALTALTLTACGSSSSSGPDEERDPPPTADPTPDPEQEVGHESARHLKPAREDGPWAQSLRECAVLAPGEQDDTLQEDLPAEIFCTFGELPLLGQTNTAPSIDDIMERTLVSHPWMATNFEAALEEMPDDILGMFRGVTKVVIDADIRPSYYWSGTGAIYLDPAYLWRSRFEQGTISTAPDHRDEYAEQLAFHAGVEWATEDDFAMPYNPPGEQRNINDVILPLAQLLFHELAHANDFLPPQQHAHLRDDETADQALYRLIEETASAQLHDTYPLSSQVLEDLALVLYAGLPATNEQADMSAEEVGVHFETDHTNTLYAHLPFDLDDDLTLYFEDAATLFEAVMMKYHFDVDMITAFTRADPTSDHYCADFIVGWAARNQVGHQSVRPRAKLAVQRLLDTQDVDRYFDDLPEPTMLEPGIDVCSQIVKDDGEAAQKPTRGQPIQRDHGHRHHHRHPGGALRLH